jgi:Tol biopolymer transport system component
LARLKRTYLLLLGLGLYLCLQAGGIAWSQVTERVSVDSAGAEGNNASTAPSNSSDGRYVAFESFATNLLGVGNDNNNKPDVFVHDRQTGTTTRVSVGLAGAEGDDSSSDPSISSDGRYVAFESDATNLLGVGNDNNAFFDVFVHDRQTGTTTRVSVYSDETESIDPSNNPSISSDGRYVAFESGGELDLTAIEILALFDVFVHDRDTDGDGLYDEPGAVSTIRMSEDSVGNEANAASSSPSISSDGRFVAFESSATNLVPGGSNGLIHVFVHDRDVDENGTFDEVGGISTVQVSVDSTGAEGIGGDSSSCSISGDGRYVAFVSDATNLVGVGNDNNGSTDVFVHDRDTDGDGQYDEPGAVSTVRVSVDSAGAEGNNNSNFPSISSDGRYVAFESDAGNLLGVGNDNNGSTDVFVHDLQTGATTRVSVDLAGVEGNGNSNSPSISADGSSVTFESDADNLVGVGNDNNLAPDIFVDDLQAAAGGGGGSDSSGGGCFIATAADGSGMAGEVK